MDQLDVELVRTTTLIAQQGLIATNLEDSRNRLTEKNIQLTENRSELEDTDIAEAISTIQKLLTNLEAAQATYARIEQTTLFDLIS